MKETLSSLEEIINSLEEVEKKLKSKGTASQLSKVRGVIDKTNSLRNEVKYVLVVSTRKEIE